MRLIYFLLSLFLVIGSPAFSERHGQPRTGHGPRPKIYPPTYNCSAICQYDEARTEVQGTVPVVYVPADPYQLFTTEFPTQGKAELNVKFLCLNLCKGHAYKEYTGGKLTGFSHEPYALVNRTKCELTDCSCDKKTRVTWEEWVTRGSVWEVKEAFETEDAGCSIAKNKAQKPATKKAKKK